MRDIPVGLQDHLDTRETTLCWCWKITRRDGVEMGFTNHDLDLTFDGTTYEASTGMLGTEVESSLGLSVDNLDVEGAIDSDSITELDLVAGLYDNAGIEVTLVNWSDVSERMIMKTGNLGEIKRGQVLFQAEVRGLAALLQQRQGRLYQYTCDARVGDARCGINLNSGTYKGSGEIVSTDGASAFVVSGIDSYANNWFSRGKVTFTSGENNGVTREVKVHFNSNGVVNVVLWAPTPFTIAPTDTFDIRAGCDKTFATCKAKFSNASNFRGFPHMPGPDFIVFVPNSDDTNLDGGGKYNGRD